MVISENLIKATAETYTRAELVLMRKAALDKLAEQEYISTASTGAGASYSIGLRAQNEELVELYTAAIHYLDFGEIASSATAYNIIFH